MSEQTDKLANELGQLSVMELIALTKKLEADWHVSATPQVSLQTPGTPGDVDNKPAEQTEFTVVLASYPADKKMALIKLVREVVGLGLVESKNLVEGAPKTLKESVSKEEMEQLKAKFTAAGGVIEVK